MVSLHRQPDSIVLVAPFVHLDEVKNPLLEVVKHADLHYMEEVGLREVTYDTGNRSKHVEYSVDIAKRVFGIGCLDVSIAERYI